MNTQKPICEDDRGILLTDNVNMDWVNSITPRYHSEYVKFTINKETNKVVIGMHTPRDAEVLLGPAKDLLGGNIYLDGSIVYSSTLNVRRNLALTGKRKLKPGSDPRIIEDSELKEEIFVVVSSWIEGLKNDR